MNRGHSGIESNGDGIYELTGPVVHETKPINETNDCVQPNELVTSFNATFTKGDIRKTSNSIDRILDVLDQQVDSLNRLKFDGNNNTKTKPEAYSDKQITHSGLNFYDPVGFTENLSSSLSQKSDPARRLLLDNYIKRCIIDERVECGCHFELGGSNELNVGKFCQTNDVDIKVVSRRRTSQTTLSLDTSSSNERDHITYHSSCSNTNSLLSETACLYDHQPQGCGLFIDSLPSSNVTITRPKDYSTGYKLNDKQCKGSCRCKLKHQQRQQANFSSCSSHGGDIKHDCNTFLIDPTTQSKYCCRSDIVQPGTPSQVEPSEIADLIGAEFITDDFELESDIGNVLEGVVDSVCDPVSDIGGQSAIPSACLSKNQTLGRESFLEALNLELPNFQTLRRDHCCHKQRQQQQQQQQQFDCSLTDESVLSLSWSQYDLNLHYTTTASTLNSISYQDINLITNTNDFDTSTRTRDSCSILDCPTEESERSEEHKDYQYYFNEQFKTIGHRRCSSLTTACINKDKLSLRYKMGLDDDDDNTSPNNDNEENNVCGNNNNINEDPRSCIHLNQQGNSYANDRQLMHGANVENSTLAVDKQNHERETLIAQAASYSSKQSALKKKRQNQEVDEERGPSSRVEPSPSSQQATVSEVGPHSLNAGSMKAVRDIAKMSIPSLSSLQYLPGQLDVPVAKMSHSNTNAGKDEKHPKLELGNNDKTIDNARIGGGKAINPNDKAKENVKHDDSCLLNRLCLCNCMSKSNHVNSKQIESSPNSILGPTQANLDSREAKKKAKTHKCSPSLKCSSSSDEKKSEYYDKGVVTQARQRQDKRQAEASETEKQSPSFLNLFKSSLRPRSPATDEGASLSGRHESYGPSGAVGNLAANSMFSSTSSDLDDGRESRTNGKSSPFGFKTDSLLSDPKEQLTTTLSSRDNKSHKTYKPNEADEASQQKDEQSDCCAKLQKTSSASSYKKFLSPRKFFSSSSGSAGESLNELSHRLKHQKLNSDRSFLSRSLNRLSGRTRKRTNSLGKREVIDVSEPIRPHSSLDQSQQDRTGSACISPTISISNTSQRDESITDSINSLNEDINLPHSLPFDDLSRRGTKSRLLTAPEIVLNRVEFVTSSDNLSNRSTKSCDMTRPSKHYSRYNSNSSRQHRQHNYEPNSSPNRQSSEISGFTSGTGSSGHYRTFSLPGSPRPTRRSPRLSQSPVQFHSPATESTKIEDGLRVCSMEHFEKHIDNVNRSQIETQKRLFTAWINHFCPNLIRQDLIEELQDGIKLIGLLATLTHDNKLLNHYEKLNRDKQNYVNRLMPTPSSRLKHLSNVSIAIDYLRKNVGMKLVNLNPMDIVSGKANVILGLCWNIILNFQLEQGFFKNPETLSDCSSSDNNLNNGTSRLSSKRSVEDGAKNICQMARGGNPYLMDEYTQKDLLTARNRIVKHINKRFNLKLTNLTSNLVDGDVLLAIIRHLLPDKMLSKLEQDLEKKQWKQIGDDERLDHCFELANKYLNVPQLFTSSDLRTQSTGENNSKPLLVYLSMLLSANSRDCSTEQMIELRRLDETLHTPKTKQQEEISSFHVKINKYLNEIDTSDKFEVDKLQTSLIKIKKIDELIGKANKSELDDILLDRCTRLKQEADQVEMLINWINQADQLFETTQKSSAELANAIEGYRNHFSPESVPKLKASLCPNLERQYRECLATARQRTLAMEQTMKNWLEYERARTDLRDWLVNAEAKLTNALRPTHSPNSGTDTDPIEKHMERLEDLIEYFELEQVDVEDLNDSNISNTNGTSANSLNMLDGHTNRSLSGSLISLGSTSSRLSSLVSSKKATYNTLFDEFELKCRLLAAMLDSDQKDALLLGVKELKSRLKYITEFRVPQVLTELRININRCEMSIKEQDESSDLDSGSKLDESVDTDGAREVCTGLNEERIVSDENEEKPGNPDKEGQLTKVTKRRNKNRSTRMKNSSPPSSKKSKATKCNNENIYKAEASPKEFSYFRLFWDKMVRASKTSLTFNIVLLICLAGICVVPLINRDACCELSQKSIPTLRFNQRPI